MAEAISSGGSKRTGDLVAAGDSGWLKGTWGASDFLPIVSKSCLTSKDLKEDIYLDLLGKFVCLSSLNPSQKVVLFVEGKRGDWWTERNREASHG